MNELSFNKSPTKYEFELTVQIRDSLGKCTGKTKTIGTNSPSKLWQLWTQHRPRQHRKKKKKETLPAATEANKLMQEIAKYAEKRQQQREQ